MKKNKTFHIQFVKHRNIFFAIAAAAIVLFIILTPFRAKLDVQFAGGTMVTYTYKGSTDAVDVKAIQSAVKNATGKEASINLTSDMVTGSANIVVTVSGNNSLSEEKVNAMNKAVKDLCKDSKDIKDLETGTMNNVDPTMGTTFFIKCLVAVAAAFLLIIIYVAIRFRKIGGWSAGVMAIVALLNDILVVYGSFLILGYTLDSNFIAVVLTILGYSVNDTIVIYDRIRENESIMGGKVSLSELVNTSINQTFGRTINTTITTVMAMLVVSIVAVVFNIHSILRFSIPMTFGLISGSFTSNCIATNLWVCYKNARAKHQAKKA